MGGYAEDALLAGTVTRPHVDIDWLLPRRELALRLSQAELLGFPDFETWGESAPGEPFYLVGRSGGLTLELGIADEHDAQPVARVHRLAFEIDGREAPAGYQVWLPNDTFDWPVASLDGLSLRVVSPLALYQLRAGISRQGSFGALSERQLESQRLLRDRFFAGRSEAELAPRVSPLAP